LSINIPNRTSDLKTNQINNQIKQIHRRAIGKLAIISIMARVSHFTEELLAPATAEETVPLMAASKSDKPSASGMHKLALKTKRAVTLPFDAVRRLGLHYKDHLHQLVNTNLSDHPEFCTLNAGSTPFGTPYLAPCSAPYGDDMATDEELARQTERNHLDYVFYIGPSNSPKTTSTGSSMILEKPAERCPDLATLWAQAYAIDCDSLVADHLCSESYDEKVFQKLIETGSRHCY
jgi:hypothetical protein